MTTFDSKAMANANGNPDSTIRNETIRNETLPRLIENSSVPDPRKPVDNPVFYLVGGHLVFGVPKAVA